jgi:hypothetical protein
MRESRRPGSPPGPASLNKRYGQQLCEQSRTWLGLLGNELSQLLTQLAHLSYLESVTTWHEPLTTWQVAYWRHWSSPFIALGQTVATFGPHWTVSPWQFSTPHASTVGTSVGVAVTVGSVVTTATG